MNWMEAYRRAMACYGMTLNGVAYMERHPAIRRRYTAHRAAGRSVRESLGRAAADCERLAR